MTFRHLQLLLAAAMLAIGSAILCCGCGTTQWSHRPVLPFCTPGCALWAVADAAELQYGQRIPNEARLRVWEKIRYRTIRGITLDQAFAEAEEAGWVPGDSYLHLVALDTIGEGPLICTLSSERHAIVVLSTRDNERVTYFDPRRHEPQTMSVKRLMQETEGFFWRIAR